MGEPVLWQPLLRDTLAALAAPPEQQVCANGSGCIACDLLNDFDDARLIAFDHAPLSDAQRSSLESLDAASSDLQPDDLVCFDNTVVRRPAWQAIRVLAVHALREFGWSGAKVQEFSEVSPGVWHRPPSDA